MKLFDETRPPSPCLARRTESTMEFLNRVTLAPYEQARDKLETLFDEYPLDDEKKEQFKRKLCGSDAQGEGAFYEMFMAGALSRLSADCRVEAEYFLNDKPIDLRVVHPRGDFYVECKTRLTSENQYGKSYPHLQELLEALDNDRELAESPFVGAVFVRRLGGSTPSKGKFLRAVKRRLPELRILEESIRNTSWHPDGELCEPELYQPNEDTEVEVKFYWHSDKKSRRFVVLNSQGGGVVKDETPSILRELEEKARQHHKPDLPYIIAINWCYPDGFQTPGRWNGGDPETEAVYGRGHFDVMDNSEPYEVRSEINQRRVDCWLEQVFREGLFVDRQGNPQHRYVSGVLFSRRATLLLNNPSWKFFGNPFATHPAPELFRRIPNIWPDVCDWSRSYTGSTRLYVQPDMIQYFPDEIRVGPNKLSATATFEHQGFLRSEVTGKVELHDLLGIDYPEPDEPQRLVEDAEREALT